MSGQARRHNNIRGKGRGDYAGSNMGGYQQGLLESPPMLQPTNYPPPLLHSNVQSPPCDSSNTRTEETVTTYTDGGKIVTTKRVVTTTEPSREYTYDQYQPLIQQPDYTLPHQNHFQQHPDSFVPMRAISRQTRPTSRDNAYEGTSYLPNKFRLQNTEPVPLLGDNSLHKYTGGARVSTPGRYRGHRPSGPMRDRRNGSMDRQALSKVRMERTGSFSNIATDEIAIPMSCISTSGEENMIDKATRKATGNKTTNREKKLSNRLGDTGAPSNAAQNTSSCTGITSAEDTGYEEDCKRKTSKLDKHDDLSNIPDVQAVFDYMVKEMNGKGLPVEICRKSGLFPVTFNENMIEDWFKSKSGKFKSIIRNGHVDCVLVYLRQMNYCLDYISKRSCKKDKCTRYHVCKDMLCGNCVYGDDCYKSHDFFDRILENWYISKELKFIQKYTNEQVLSIMQCRYPHVCHDWNQEEGCGLGKCEKLHICETFMLGKCQNGDDCDYGHDRMSAHNRSIIQAYEMNNWYYEHFRRIVYIQRKHIQKKQVVTNSTGLCASAKPENLKTSDTTTGTVVALCEKYLLGSCKESKCRLYHNEDLRLPYVWQVKLWHNWINISQSEAVEKEYCAFKDKSEPFHVKDMETCLSLLVVIAFQPVISARLLENDKTLEARRLSTRSFVVKDPMSFRTQWRWFYMSHIGEAQMIIQDGLQHTLEKKYMCGQTEYTLMKQGFPYIDFKSMSLFTSKGHATVLRRPLLVTREDVDQRKIPPSPDSAVEIKVPLPRGWAQWDTLKIAEPIKLAKTSDEYRKVDEKFFECLDRGRLQIRGVFRIQNSEQWSQFVSKEASMLIAVKRAQKSRDKVDKRYLFHGTDSFAAVKGICNSNLDPRVSGKNATNFGQGAYFAVESRLAHQYTTAPDRYVFMVNVLVGEFTKGKSVYRKPPEKPDTDGEFYDSCVDDEEHPMKFVVFDSNQYYPEYLIWYGDTDEDDF